MTALAELMTADAFGRPGEPGSLTALQCPHGVPSGWYCQQCAQDGEGPAAPPDDDVLSPLPEDVVTEPWSWARVTGATATGLVLFVWAFALAGMYLAEWRGSP